jgi:CRP/FNR family cyclic AMP-dependent transcriptional regulator
MKRQSKPLREVLLESEWLSRVPISMRDRVLAEAYETYHVDKEVVVQNGESVRSWMGVAEGFLKVSNALRDGKVVMFGGIPEGAWLGEGAVLNRKLWTYDVVAKGPARVIHIPRATFRWLLDTSFEFSHFIIDHLNERMGQFMSMVEINQMTDPAARLARTICVLCNPFIYPGLGPLIHLTQEELGELAGLTRQRAHKAIKELERASAIRVEYGKLLVTDIAALRRYGSKD